MDSSASYSGIVLYKAARDVLDMYRALTPIYWAYQLENDAAFAITFHNDCMYIAHSLTTLSILFKMRLIFSPLSTSLFLTSFERLNRISGNTKANPTFSDFIPLLKQLGEKCFKEQMVHMAFKTFSHCWNRKLNVVSSLRF